MDRRPEPICPSISRLLACASGAVRAIDQALLEPLSAIWGALLSRRLAVCDEIPASQGTTGAGGLALGGRSGQRARHRRPDAARRKRRYVDRLLRAVPRWQVRR